MIIDNSTRIAANGYPFLINRILSVNIIRNMEVRYNRIKQTY